MQQEEKALQEEQELQSGAAAAGRRARFGALPERVRIEDMVEERPAAPRDPARDAYDPNEFVVRYGA
ncbi:MULTISPECIES: hypothetical protein [unclassified Streptomyces]|uniref:hypothetical protein n=1 Tax=unclassified Streptomyces TaxID=2593676 RepID=UPI003317335E